MTQQTDQERVLETLGADEQGHSPHPDANGQISKQFTTGVSDTHITLGEQPFEEMVDTIVDNINTVNTSTLSKPVVRGLLKGLYPQDHGTQNHNILFSALFFSLVVFLHIILCHID